jgi:hypothetical protein
LWKYLPCPEKFVDFKIQIEDVNFFLVKDNWLKRRRQNLIREIKTITSLESEYNSSLKKVKSSRYIPSLYNIPVEKRKELSDYLNGYLKVIS